MRSLSEIDRDMAGMTKRCKYRISIACYSGTCTYPSCDCPRPPSARVIPADFKAIKASPTRGVDACRVGRFNTRVCERGTSGCVVSHGVEGRKP